MKKPIISLVVIFLILLTGSIIPKITIKNPDLSSSPCAENAVKTQSRFPASLVKTMKVNRFTISEVWMSYYTLFGVKINKETYVSCLLPANNDSQNWATYKNSQYGFSFDYPASLLVQKETDGPDAVFLISKDSGKADSVLVNINQTNAADINKAYAETNPGWVVANNLSSTTVAGLPAFREDREDGSCAGCHIFFFVHQGFIYTLNIHLPKEEDVQMIQQSFQFTNATPPNAPTDCRNYQNFNLKISCPEGIYVRQFSDNTITQLTFFDKNKTYYIEGSEAYILYIGIRKDIYNGLIDEYLKTAPSLQLSNKETIDGQTSYNLTCKPHYMCGEKQIVFYKGNVYEFSNGQNLQALPTYNKLISLIKFN